MKQVITNNKKVRITAEGRSIVEGSFARITEIKGKSVNCKNLIVPNNNIANQYATVEKTVEGGFKVTITSENPNTQDPTIWIRMGTVTLLPNTTYFLSGSPSKNNNVYLHISSSPSFYDYGKGSIVKNESNTSITATVYFAIKNNIGTTENPESAVGKSFVFYPMLNEGTTPLPYQPYFSGKKNSLIKGIYSQNRNIVSNDKEILNGGSGAYTLSQDIIDLINSGRVESITARQKYSLMGYKYLKDPKLLIALYYDDGTIRKNRIAHEINIGNFKEYKVTIQIDKTKKCVNGIVWFNDYSDNFIAIDGIPPYISKENYIEINGDTRYTKQISSIFDLRNDWILRSAIDSNGNEVYDSYYPEIGIVVRRVDNLGNAYNIESYTTETLTKVYNSYREFNNGYEKMVTTQIDSNGLTPYDYGAIPTITTEYVIEKRQYGDRSRFDFFMLDGESFSGIGYSKLKSTNQLQYEQEPDRQSDGSMNNIEDYNTFVMGVVEFGFNCQEEETYRRLKEKLLSKRTFEVSYYDKDFDIIVTKEMYVKPIDLDNFLSYGDEIIGMDGFTLSFVPTMNEETRYTVKFLDGNYANLKTFEGESGIKFGRDIETIDLPSGYTNWLIIESGFNNNNHITIKGKKKLSIFGNTTLLAIK